MEERQSDLLDKMQGPPHETEERQGRFEAQPRLDEPPALSFRRLANPPRRALSTPPALAQADSFRLCEQPKDLPSEIERSEDDPPPQPARPVLSITPAT
jgi:hypothetical protein